MSNFTSDTEYYKYKTTIYDTCSCNHKLNQMCGICFYKGIALPLNQAVNTKCKRCQGDSIKFRALLYQDSKYIKLKPDCSIHCLWWDWFDYNRQQLAKDNKASLTYVKEEEKKDKKEDTNNSKKN